MSFYGSKNIVDSVRLEKKRFPANNTLRFGNVIGLFGYNPVTLESMNVVKEQNASVVDTGDMGCVTVAIGPANTGKELTNVRIIDSFSNVTLEPEVNCVVLEGILDDGQGNVFNGDEGIPHFVTLAEPAEMLVVKTVKLLVFKVQNI